jgi:hypothetical protein
VTWYSLEYRYHHFGGTCCIYPLIRTLTHTGKEDNAAGKVDWEPELNKTISMISPTNLILSMNINKCKLKTEYSIASFQL